MFSGELTLSPGPGLFGVIQDPLGALGELFFGHPQRDGVSGTSMISMWSWWKKHVGCHKIGGFTVYFRFGKEMGPSCGLVELFFIILQLQIHKHHDQVYQNGSNAARGSRRLKDILSSSHMDENGPDMGMSWGVFLDGQDAKTHDFHT